MDQNFHPMFLQIFLKIFKFQLKTGSKIYMKKVI